MSRNFAISIWQSATETAIKSARQDPIVTSEATGADNEPFRPCASCLGCVKTQIRRLLSDIWFKEPTVASNFIVANGFFAELKLGFVSNFTCMPSVLKSFPA
jgi:hypothetical protein